NQEAREMALKHNFVPTIGSTALDLILNYARCGDVGRAEGLIEQTERETSQTGSWHRWLWRLRMAQARAEIACGHSKWDEALHWAEQTVTQCQAKLRPKYEALGHWTRARALTGLGRKAEAISDLMSALNLARRIGDPALFVRIASTLLDLEGTDELLRETRTTAQRIVAEIPTPETRLRFEQAEPVRKWKLVAS